METGRSPISVGSVLDISRNGEHWRGDVLNVTGFSAQGDRRVVIGLGGNDAPVQAHIRWADGTEQDLGSFESGKYHSIRKTLPAMPVFSTLEADHRSAPDVSPTPEAPVRSQ